MKLLINNIYKECNITLIRRLKNYVFCFGKNIYILKIPKAIINIIGYCIHIYKHLLVMVVTLVLHPSNADIFFFTLLI